MTGAYEESIDLAVAIVQSEKDSARGCSLSEVGEGELPGCRCLPEELSVLFHIVLGRHSLGSQEGWYPWAALV